MHVPYCTRVVPQHTSPLPYLPPLPPLSPSGRYLLNVQNSLFARNEQLEGHLAASVRDADELRLQADAGQERIAGLEKELRHHRKAVTTYEHLLRSGAALGGVEAPLAYICGDCGKAFGSEEYLLAHCQRRGHRSGMVGVCGEGGGALHTEDDIRILARKEMERIMRERGEHLRSESAKQSSSAAHNTEQQYLVVQLEAVQARLAAAEAETVSQREAAAANAVAEERARATALEAQIVALAEASARDKAAYRDRVLSVTLAHHATALRRKSFARWAHACEARRRQQEMEKLRRQQTQEMLRRGGASSGGSAPGTPSAGSAASSTLALAGSEEKGDGADGGAVRADGGSTHSEWRDPRISDAEMDLIVRNYKRDLEERGGVIPSDTYVCSVFDE